MSAYESDDQTVDRFRAAYLASAGVAALGVIERQEGSEVAEAAARSIDLEWTTVCRGGPTADCGNADWHSSHVIEGLASAHGAEVEVDYLAVGPGAPPNAAHAAGRLGLVLDGNDQITEIAIESDGGALFVPVAMLVSVRHAGGTR